MEQMFWIISWREMFFSDDSQQQKFPNILSRIIIVLSSLKPLNGLNNVAGSKLAYFSDQFWTVFTD